MTKEQLLEKDNITVDELLQYFNVKTTQELENLFAMKVAAPYLDLAMNDPYLFNGFKLIYEKVSIKNYNPIEETLMLYMVLLEGLFGIDGEDVVILTKTFGTFKTVYFISKFIEDNDATQYYRKLYENYTAKMTSLPLIVSEGIDAALNFIEKKLDGVNEEKLTEMVNKIQNGFEDFKKSVN